jgi:hypothetical protein
LRLTLDLLLEGGKLLGHVRQLRQPLLTFRLRCMHLCLRCGKFLPQGCAVLGFTLDLRLEGSKLARQVCLADLPPHREPASHGQRETEPRREPADGEPQA